MTLTQSGHHSMGREINIDLIRALEEQIEEGKGDIIKLKRVRNSLLNISTRVPPEILGHIFVWSFVEAGWVDSWRTEGLQKGSYNFLLVCHHWFEVASGTPELWASWGTTLQDWKKRRRHWAGSSPLDLVLDGGKSDPFVTFDKFLQGAVRSRVMKDTIRRVHLVSHDSDTLATIVSSLTPDDKGGQNENIESIVWRNRGFTTVDVSNFFARSRLSRLRFLDLYGEIQILSWDHLASRTTLLTALSLDISMSPSTPTISGARLLSILTSNPNLQELTLSDAGLPGDADTSTFKVQLAHLKTLSLTGEPRHLSGLLHQLILPDMLDDMSLAGSGSTAEDMSQILAPYLQDYFRRNTSFRDRLMVSTSCDDSVSISVDVISTQAAPPTREPPQVSLTVFTDLPPYALGQSLISLITLVPGEYVVDLDCDFDMELPEDLFFMMPNIESLCLSDVFLSPGFLQPSPNGPHADTKLLPSLESLCLRDIFLSDNDWSHLTTYLAHQTSDGQAISFYIFGDTPHMPQEVVDEIEDLVKEFGRQEDQGVDESE